MPVQTLTNQFLSTLPSIVPPKGAVSFFDTEIKGFILEHRTSGGATYYFRYRDAAQRLRMARIGRLAAIERTHHPSHRLRHQAAADPQGPTDHLRTTPMPTIKINNVDYDTETLSNDAKAQLASIQFCDQELQRLQAQAAAYQTARAAYSKALQAALPANDAS